MIFLKTKHIMFHRIKTYQLQKELGKSMIGLKVMANFVYLWNSIREGLVPMGLPCLVLK